MAVILSEEAQAMYDLLAKSDWVDEITLFSEDVGGTEEGMDELKANIALEAKRADNGVALYRLVRYG